MPASALVRHGLSDAHAATDAAGSDETSAAGVDREEDRLLPDSGVFVTIHHPSGTGMSGDGRVVVLVPPLFEEMPRTRKVLLNLARELATAGVVAVRFDYRGTGLGRGHFEDVTLTSMRHDLASVVELCQERGASSVALLGFRLGGYLAAEHTHRACVARIVLWEPVLDLGAFMRHMLRSDVANQMVSVGKIRFDQRTLVAKFAAGEKVLVDGYRTGPLLYRELVEAAALSWPQLAPAGDKLRLFFWRSKPSHDEARTLGLASDLIPEVRFSWSDIRFLQPRHGELFARTLAALTEGASAPRRSE